MARGGPGTALHYTVSPGLYEECGVLSLLNIVTCWPVRVLSVSRHPSGSESSGISVIVVQQCIQTNMNIYQVQNSMQRYCAPSFGLECTDLVIISFLVACVTGQRSIISGGPTLTLLLLPPNS